MGKIPILFNVLLDSRVAYVEWSGVPRIQYHSKILLRKLMV